MRDVMCAVELHFFQQCLLPKTLAPAEEWDNLSNHLTWICVQVVLVSVLVALRCVLDPERARMMRFLCFGWSCGDCYCTLWVDDADWKAHETTASISSEPHLPAGCVLSLSLLFFIFSQSHSIFPLFEWTLSNEIWEKNFL